MKILKGVFEEIKKDYVGFVDSNLDYKDRLYKARAVFENIILAVFDKNKEDFKKYNDKALEFNGKLRKGLGQRMYEYRNNFGGKKEFLFYFEKIETHFKQKVEFLWSETSLKGVHRGKNLIATEQTIIRVLLDLNELTKWFFKNQNEDCDFIIPYDVFLKKYTKAGINYKEKEDELIRRERNILSSIKKIRLQETLLNKREKEAEKTEKDGFHKSSKLELLTKQIFEEKLQLETFKKELKDQVLKTENSKNLLEKEIEFLKGQLSIQPVGLEKIISSFEDTKANIFESFNKLNYKDERIKTLLGEKLKIEKTSIEQLNKFKIENEKSVANHKVEKLKLIIKFGVGILLLVGVISILLFNFIYSPFQMNVRVTKDKTLSIHQEYPELTSEAKMLFYFPNGVIERQITSLNDIIIPEVPSDLKGEKIKVKLEDKYWKVSDENFDIKRNASTIKICPNESLSKIRGKVSDIFGNVLVNAKIRFDGVFSDSDNQGKFNLQIPVEQRKIQYNIRIEKDGFVSQWREYVAGTEIDVRLEKEI